MAKRLQLRRGTTAQHAAFTGAVNEVTVDTDKKTLVVHDGVTAGGEPLAVHRYMLALLKAAGFYGDSLFREDFTDALTNVTATSFDSSIGSWVRTFSGTIQLSTNSIDAGGNSLLIRRNNAVTYAEITLNVPADHIVTFYNKTKRLDSGGSWSFSIDGVTALSSSASGVEGEWELRHSHIIPTGVHTYRWTTGATSDNQVNHWIDNLRWVAI